MHPVILALFEFSVSAVSMCGAGLVILIIGLMAARTDVASARGLDKIVALSNLCFAIPLAVFGAEHLSGVKLIMNGVPSYMPWRLFWVYFVGFALIAASFSIATKIQVRWSGLLFGIMMVIFVALLHIPSVIAKPHERIPWTIVLREMSFAGGGWALAGAAMGGSSKPGKVLITVSRVLIAITAIFFGIQHFLHPLGLPGVPLERQMATWVPARVVIDYLTGAFLLVAGVCFLLARKTRMAATYLGTWILLMVLLIYGPVLITGLLDPSTAMKVEGINYFADTLLFGGVILSLASAMVPVTETPKRVSNEAPSYLAPAAFSTPVSNLSKSEREK
jgi:uncharacterized membrane protein YphA (DoxX/SURF4 family)